MMDFGAVEGHIWRERLERQALLGELIADGVLAIWSGIKFGGNYVSKQISRNTKLPAFYTTSLRRS